MNEQRMRDLWMKWNWRAAIKKESKWRGMSLICWIKWMKVSCAERPPAYNPQISILSICGQFHPFISKIFNLFIHSWNSITAIISSNFQFAERAPFIQTTQINRFALAFHCFHSFTCCPFSFIKKPINSIKNIDWLISFFNCGANKLFHF